MQAFQNLKKIDLSSN
jgi:hypothetical protein